MLMFCANATHVEGGDKDSLKNARETGEFVFNLATHSLRQQMNKTSATLPRDTDEFAYAGLTAASCQLLKAPRVLESPVALECKVVDIIDLPRDDVTGLLNTMTIGRIVGVHVQKHLIRDGRVNTAAEQPLARLGYLDYALCNDVFTMERPPE